MPIRLNFRSAGDCGLRVVNNHVVEFDTSRLVLLRDASESVKEQTISEFHDVGLVHASDFLQFGSNRSACGWGQGYLAVVFQREIKGETRDSLGLGASRDLQALNDTGIALMLQARVFTLSVFTDDGKVDVGMAGGESGQGLAKDDRSVNVELLPHGDIP